MNDDTHQVGRHGEDRPWTLSTIVGEPARWWREGLVRWIGKEALGWIVACGVHGALTALRLTRPAEIWQLDLLLVLAALALVVLALVSRRRWARGKLERLPMPAAGGVLALGLFAVAGVFVMVLVGAYAWDGNSTRSPRLAAALLPVVIVWITQAEHLPWMAEIEKDKQTTRPAFLVVSNLAGVLVLNAWLQSLGPASGWRAAGMAIAAGLAPVLLGILSYLQVREAGPRPSAGDAPIPDLEALMKRESGWLRRRRPDGPTDAHGRPQGLLGLALSGGGIRSATVSLGVMQGLGVRRVFERVDYLSTVSGGGWAGSAVSSRMADETSAFHPGDPRQWEVLARGLRRHGDYLIPGGAGFNSETIWPAFLVLFGAVVNLVKWGAGGVAAVLLLNHYSDANTPERWLRTRLVDGVTGIWPSSSGLFISRDGQISGYSGLHVYDWLGILFLLALAVFVLGCGRFLLGAMLVNRSHGRLGTVVAAKALFWLMPLGLVLLALHGSVVPTVMVSGAIVVAPLALLARKLTSNQRKTMATALFGAQGLAFKYSPQLAPATRAITKGWHDALVGALHVTPRPELPLYAGVAVLVLLALGMLLSVNATSPHELWAERIRDAYLRGRRGEEGPAERPLAELSLAHAGATPLHIVTAAVNTPGSRQGTLHKRGTARFEMSPCAVGGPATGWASPDAYGDELTLSRAVAISAAAANSQGGEAVPRWLHSLLIALNLSLGFWLRNPALAARHQDVRFRPWGHFWMAYAWKDLFRSNREDDSLIYVSDGGHHDNLGLSTLVEREPGTIIVVDAAADPAYTFSDLAISERLVSVDDGWELELDVQPARPIADGKRVDADQANVGPRLVQQPVLLGRLRRAKDQKSIRLVYIKAAVDAGAPFEVLRYAEAHPPFPQESTADQFFDEAQFEAYRKLGAHLGDLAADVIEQIEHQEASRPFVYVISAA